MHLRKLCMIVPALILISLLSCEKAEEIPPGLQVSFEASGLDGRIVHELNLVGDVLFAATDNGIYKRELSAGTGWGPVGLQGKNTQAFQSIDDQTYLTAVNDFNIGEYQLFGSNDGGVSWAEMADNFGGSYPEPIYDLEYDENNQEILATGSGVVAKSTDKGNTWEPVFGEWQILGSGLDFVRINPVNQDIWAGGQNGIEGFLLAHHDQSEDSWKTWIDLLPSPSTGKNIAFDPDHAAGLIIGGEDGILHTSDNGLNWSIIKQDHEARFYFGVDYDHEVHSRIYAASWVKDFDNPQPLILYVSEDSGQNWTSFEHEDSELFGGVWTMVQRKEGDATRLYMGLYKGGVYEVSIQ